MAGFHLDPLTVVLAFLITARCISHSVQFVVRFDYEVAGGVEPYQAARIAMLGLIKPGLLGVATDAAGIMVVVLAPIPLLQKVAIIGGGLGIKHYNLRDSADSRDVVLEQAAAEICASR